MEVTPETEFRRLPEGKGLVSIGFVGEEFEMVKPSFSPVTERAGDIARALETNEIIRGIEEPFVGEGGMLFVDTT